MIKILLVEDTHLLREGLKLVLKKVSDFQVEEPAGTENEAIEGLKLILLRRLVMSEEIFLKSNSNSPEKCFYAVVCNYALN